MVRPEVGQVFGRYRLDRVLGEGGMGVVFAATDQRLGRPVAVKVITTGLADSADFRARFQHEAEALARLDSPHVIAIHDHDEVDGTPYIVTQLVDGTDLGALVADGPLPARLAVTVCAQVARGLRDAHARGLVHRDVKPANVLLRGGEETHAYLCDFGIARGDAPEGATEGPAPTATGAVAGTWAYLAPERAAGTPATPRSDLYALGCVLWVCLTGREPYTGTAVQVAMGHDHGPVPQLPSDDDLATSLNRVLTGLLAKDPAMRYRDAAAVLADLEPLAARAPDRPIATAAAAGGAAATTLPRETQVRGSSVRPAHGDAGRRRRLGAVVGASLAALLLLGGAATAWVLNRGGGDGDGGGGEDAPVSLTGGDLDGDGLGDVMVNQVRPTSVDSERLRTLPSNGVRFGSAVESDAEAGYPKTADVDDDGALDVVWIDSFGDDEALRVSVVPAHGDSWEPVRVAVDPALGIGGYSALVSDVTGDSRPDLLLLGDPSEGNDSLYVAEADGRGFAEPEAWYDAEGAGGMIWTGDYDGDGTDDVLYFATIGRTDLLTVLSPEGGAFRESASRPLTGPAINPTIAPILVGDVDGDGADELVSPGVTRRAVFVIGVDDGEIGVRDRWHQTKRSDDEARDQIFNSGVSDYTLSDVDGDGKADLVELHRPEEIDVSEELSVEVLVSTGTAFADPEVRGAFGCAPGCDDGFSLVD